MNDTPVATPERDTLLEVIQAGFAEGWAELAEAAGEITGLVTASVKVLVDHDEGNMMAEGKLSGDTLVALLAEIFTLIDTAIDHEDFNVTDDFLYIEYQLSYGDDEVLGAVKVDPEAYNSERSILPGNTPEFDELLAQIVARVVRPALVKALKQEDFDSDEMLDFSCMVCEQDTSYVLAANRGRGFDPEAASTEMNPADSGD